MGSRVHQLDLDRRSDLLVGAALLRPGFQRDLSTWRLELDRKGNLRQELSPACSSFVYERVAIQLRSVVDRHSMSMICNAVGEASGHAFNREYAVPIDDVSVSSLTFMIDGQPETVVVHGRGTYPGGPFVPELEHYRKLWDLVAQVAPYRDTVTKAADQAKAKEKYRMLFGD